MPLILVVFQTLQGDRGSMVGTRSKAVVEGAVLWVIAYIGWPDSCSYELTRSRKEVIHERLGNMTLGRTSATLKRTAWTVIR